MKKITVFLFALLAASTCTMSFAQGEELNDTIYLKRRASLSNLKNAITTKEQAYRYGVVSLVDDTVRLKVYSMAGDTLLQEVNYSKFSVEESIIMSQISYWPNGQIRLHEIFKGDKQELLQYYADGKMRRHEYYDAKTKKTSGLLFDNHGNLLDYEPYHISPQFAINGMDGLMKFIQDNLKYPKEAVKAKIEGKVVVSFIVNKEGWAERIQVTKSPHQLLSDEAIRIVRLLPKFESGKVDGEYINEKYVLPISFRLPH